MEPPMISIFNESILEEKVTLLEVLTGGDYKFTKGAIQSFAELPLHHISIMYKIDINGNLLEAEAMSIVEANIRQAIFEQKMFQEQNIKNKSHVRN